MNFRGFRIDQLSPSAPMAILLGCVGLLIIAIVIHFMIKGLGMPTWDFLREEAEKVNEKKLLILYILSTVFLTSIGFALGVTSGFAQVLVSIADLKWVFFLWYAFIIWVKKKNRIYLFYIILYEFTSGFYSYFSSFKEVIFYVIILSLTFLVHIKLRQILWFLLTLALLIPLFLTWSIIKGDYRNFLNQGTRAQAIVVSREDAYGKMIDQVKNLKWSNYELTTNMALYRIQYVYHFSLAMDRVPTITPFQNGDVWKQNMLNVFTPRILFPDKPIYDASIKASKFTGRLFAGQQQGTSFSLGYFADSYVDFGPFGMFLPLAMIGLLVGFIYRRFYLLNKLNIFCRFAIINVVLSIFIAFESDGLFLFGRLITSFVTFYLLAKLVFPALQRWIYK
jgi:hypothetical protein